MNDHLDLGSATIEGPCPIIAGEYGTWTITYTAGPLGLDEDAVIGLTWLFAANWAQPQSARPDRPNFFSVTTNSRARPEISFHRKGYRRPWWPLLGVRVVDAPVLAGEKVQIVLGDTSFGSPGQCPPTALDPRGALRLLVDVCGTGRLIPLTPDFTFPVVASVPSRITIVAPSEVNAGAGFESLVRVEDRWGNVVSDLKDSVTLKVPGSPGGVAPLQVAFEPGPAAVRVKCPPVPTPGIYRLTAALESGLAAVSNPIDVCTTSKAPRLWGDLHGQTREALGLRPVDEQLAIARDVAGLDFASTQGNDFDIEAADWDSIRRETKRAHCDGRFVVFLGYEWSGNVAVGGDRNVILSGDDGPILRSGLWCVDETDEEACHSLTELYGRLRNQGALMIPHVGGRYANLKFHDPELEPVIEVCSGWGYFEWFALQALELGMHVGFVGGTDDHKGRPGMRSSDQGIFAASGGLTCVLGAERSRRSIWEAIKARRCYATTGDRILLNVSVAGATMGEAIRQSGPVSIECRVVGTAPIKRIELRRNADVIATHRTVPLATDSPPTWIEVAWSGVRPRRRYAAFDWDIRIELNEKQTDRIVPSHAADQLQREESGELHICSRTVGDEHSVWIPWEGGSLCARLGAFDLSLKPGEAYTQERVNTTYEYASASLTGWSARPTLKETEVEWSDTPGPGRNAYWVKVIQTDGQMAISSPVYVAT